MREEINARVVRPWWERGELDRRRWRELHDLINELLADDKETRGRELLKKTRFILEDPRLDDEARRLQLEELEKRVTRSVESGSLDASQHALLRDVFSESRR